MPSYRDHLLVGSLISTVAIYLLQPFITFSLETAVSTVAFILLASIFPDVDHRNAKVHKLLRAFLTLLAGGFAVYKAFPHLYLMISAGVLSATAVYFLFETIKPHHRTITHTFTASVVFSTAVGVFCFLFLGTFLPAVFSLVAYTSHLAIDGTID